MKIISSQWRLAAMCAGLLVCGQSRAQDVVRDPWWEAAVNPPGEAAIDDYLIALAKNSSTNCIMDARDVDPQIRIKPFPEFVARIKFNCPPVRKALFDAVQAQAILTQHAVKDYGTLLFWHEPELTEAARLSLERRAADEELLVEAKSDDDGLLTPRQALESRYLPLQARWAKYLREAQGWDGQSAQVDITIPVVDLPPDLRALTLAEVRYTLYKRINLSAPIFSAEYWDTMRLVIDTSEKHPDTGRPIPYLSLWSPPLGPGPATRLGRLDAPREPTQAAETAPKVQQVAQAAPDNTAPTRFPHHDKFLAMVFAPELETDAALQAKVSLEAKRRPLKDIVGDLKKQSGVALALAPDAPPASAPVTLRVSEMPLWKMMASLSRIYGATWSKNGAAYTLRSAKLDPLDLGMLRRGFWYRWRLHYLDTYNLQQRENSALAREILRHVRRDQLNSPQGAPFSDVPQELRDQVRKYLQEEDAQRILDGQAQLDATPLEGMVLRFAPLNSREPDKVLWGRTAFSGKDAQLGAFTADGRFICTVFNRFKVKAPREGEWVTNTPGLPPFPPGWKPGDPVPPPPPKGWKKGDPVPVFPPDWKKGDPWPEYPEPQAALPQDGALGEP